MPKYFELLLCSSLKISLTGFFIGAWLTICGAGMNLNERLYPAGDNPCKGFLALPKLLLPLPLSYHWATICSPTCSLSLFLPHYWLTNKSG